MRRRATVSLLIGRVVSCCVRTPVGSIQCGYVQPPTLDWGPAHPMTTRHFLNLAGRSIIERALSLPELAPNALLCLRRRRHE